MMKLAVFLAVVAVAVARPQQQYGPPQQAASNGYQQPQQNGYQGNLVGAAQTVDENQAGMPYQFQWEVRAPEFNNDYSHQQSSDGRLTQGEYRVLLPDSRVQIVRFTSDENGYVADVQYEGTAQYPQASNNVPVVAAYSGAQQQQQQSYRQQQGAGAQQQQSYSQQQGGAQQQQSYSQQQNGAQQQQYSQGGQQQQQDYSQQQYNQGGEQQQEYAQQRPSNGYGAPSQS